MNSLHDYFNELLVLKEPKKEEDMGQLEIEKKEDTVVPRCYKFLSKLYSTDIEFYNYMDKADIIPRNDFINYY